MKAVIKTKREHGAVEVLDRPSPPAPIGREVLIAVKSSALCGSDVHSYEYIPSSHFMTVPVILGHECSGVVAAVGELVKTLRPGDRVMGESNKYCGVCPNCRVGKTNVCTDSLMRGITVDGVMAGLVTLDEQFVHRIPDGVGFDEAAVAQPLSVSVHGVFDNCCVMPGDDVVVFGPGIIGQAAAQLARAKGAGRVVLIGTDADEESRLPIAREMGFLTHNAQRAPLKEALQTLLGRENVDVAIECSGAPVALNTAIEILRKSGWLTVLGIFSKPAEIDLTTAVRKELNLRLSYTSTWKDYETALSLLAAGRLNLTPLCNAYPCEEAEQAFQDAIAKTVLKPILHF